MFEYCLCLNDHFYGHHFSTEDICLKEGEKANLNTFNEKLKKVVLKSQKNPRVMSWSIMEE